MCKILNREKSLYNLLPVALVIFCWYEIEMSAGYENLFQCLSMKKIYILLNIVTLAVVYIFLNSIIMRKWISGIVFSLMSALLSVINHYTIKLSGRPLSIMEIKNAKTAMNVISAYKIKIDYFVVAIAFVFLIALVICFFIKKSEEKIELKKKIQRNIIFLIAGVVLLYFGYAGPKPIKPQKTVGWSWIEAYHQYGYIACSIEMIAQTRNIIEMPEGYTETEVENLESAISSDDDTSTPDIILILNESFYDLRRITNLKVDIPYMDHIDNMKNCVKGYTIVPSEGGGTNSSEYELLTSNSLQLMKGITPFNILNMKNSNSIVSHLKQLGYDTTGAHSESSINYSRGRAYPDMGFEHVYFDDNFINKEYYKNRWFESDESVYRNLISWYEEDMEKSPKFMYLLTIQNHGGWDLNEKKDDIVHALNDFGEHDDEVDEYLTCIYQSDAAFSKLTEYFQNVDKNVVICMVGDHSPAFARDIIDDKYSDAQKKYLLRSTPFIIWANFDIDDTPVGDISMNYLVPEILKVAKVKRSPYYNYMLQLKDMVPVLTSYDVYKDKNNQEYLYTENTKYTKYVNDYFCLEFNNLSENRIQKLFDPN